jgi:hypothetical protein
MSEASIHRGGRKEVLTLELARKIVKFVELMPDSEIPVSWANIELHVAKTFGVALKRNVLSSKEFDGQKPIYDAYLLASDVEKQLRKQGPPKYANSSRGALRTRIAELEAKVDALVKQLEDARRAQLTKLDLFRATRLDLRKLVDDVQNKDAF